MKVALKANSYEDEHDCLSDNTHNSHYYNGQGIQNVVKTAALPAAQPEADLRIEWQTVIDTLADGTEVKLRKRIYHPENPNYGPLPDDLLVSPRVAPPVIGMGLLEAIPQEDLEANVDPADTDGDGISGKQHLNEQTQAFA